MSDYDFDRVNVLLAEDSPFIRSLLVNSLKVLGVGNVYAVEHGGDAIHFLQRVKNEPMKVGSSKSILLFPIGICTQLTA